MPIEPDDLDIPPLPPPPVVHSPPPLRSQLDIVRTGSNARWGAVVAGVFVTGATWITLQLFGMGLGGFVVWSVIAPIFAAFAGGLVVSRLAPSPNRWNRMLHGTLMWSVTAIAGVVAVLSLAAGLARVATWPAPRRAAVDDGESSLRAQRAEALAARARHDERAAADAAEHVMLGLAMALLLGLVAANAGALATGQRDRRRVI